MRLMPARVATTPRRTVTGVVASVLALLLTVHPAGATEGPTQSGDGPATTSGPPAAAGPSGDGCVDCPQPDAMIRRKRDSAYVGDDLHDTGGIGQTVAASLRRQGRATFLVRVQNDGPVTDTFAVLGSSHTLEFKVRYYRGTNDATRSVKAGTNRVRNLAPGESRVIRAVVEAKPGARVGSRYWLRVAALSVTDPGRRDLVRANVERSAATPIRGRAAVGVTRARAWAADRGASRQFRNNASLYWEVAGSRGVRADVAYAQSAKETAFGRFGGVVDPSFRNPCGLKITAGGANDDPTAHARFPTWRIGVIACVDHLALYAGAPGYPRSGSPDPRHFPSIAGTAPTVEALGGRWAPAPDYGRSIVADYLNPMLGIS